MQIFTIFSVKILGLILQIETPKGKISYMDSLKTLILTFGLK